MNDPVQIALIAAILPATMAMLSNIVTHLLANRTRKEQNKKLDTIEELSNSMLSHQVEKKEEAEKKLEQSLVDENKMLRIQLAEANRTNALYANAPKKTEP